MFLFVISGIGNAFRPSKKHHEDCGKKTKDTDVNIQDLFYPRRLWYLQRFRLNRSRNASVRSKLWKVFKPNSFEDSSAKRPSPAYSSHDMKLFTSGYLAQVEPTTDSSVSSQPTYPTSIHPGEIKSRELNVLEEKHNSKLCDTRLAIDIHQVPFRLAVSNQASEGPTTTRKMASRSVRHPSATAALDSLTHFGSNPILVVEPATLNPAETDIRSCAPTSYGNLRDLFARTTTVDDDSTNELPKQNVSFTWTLLFE